jgi:hypothetical protein
LGAAGGEGDGEGWGKDEVFRVTVW